MGIEQQYEQIVTEQLALAKEQVKNALVTPEELSVDQIREVVGNYRVAIEPNFIAWMQQAYATTKSATAKDIIKKNIDDEVSEDHPAMLREFSRSTGVIISPRNYAAVAKPVLKMWELFGGRDPIVNVAVAAVLENTSLVFIPYLAHIAKQAGCTDFTYTDTHGEADILHAQELYRGLVEEMTQGINPWRTVATATSRTVEFLEEILTPK